MDTACIMVVHTKSRPIMRAHLSCPHRRPPQLWTGLSWTPWLSLLALWGWLVSLLQRLRSSGESSRHRLFLHTKSRPIMRGSIAAAYGPWLLSPKTKSLQGQLWDLNSCRHEEVTAVLAKISFKPSPDHWSLLQCRNSLIWWIFPACCYRSQSSAFFSLSLACMHHELY